MKATTFLLATLIAMPAAQAVFFDVEGFGRRLGGWRDDRTALYSLSEGVYRTHVPSITGTPGGGMLLSTQVDAVADGRTGAACRLSLTFSAAGVLEAAQITGLIEGRNLDTGLIRRPAPRPMAPAAEGEDAGSAAAPTASGNPTDELISNLFGSFDSEFGKITRSNHIQKRDLLSRICYTTADCGDIAAGLRHNINLILQHVNRYGSAKQVVAPGYETSQGRRSWWKSDSSRSKPSGHPAR